jgi:CheY-like chemotaxis protein
MPVITIFSASQCHADEIARLVADRLGYQLLTEDSLLSEATSRFGLAREKLDRAMHGPRSVFNRLTREKERSIAYLRSAMAESIKDGDIVYQGFAGHLLPKSLTNVLRVCLVAKQSYRIGRIRAGDSSLPEKEAKKVLAREDEARQQWTLHLFGLSPWDKSLYDVFLPMDSTTVEAAVDEISANALKPPLRTTPASQKAMKDFLLDCQVYVTLVEEGHDVDVSSSAGEVTLTINRYVMRLDHYEAELKKLVSGMDGVVKVNTKVGPHYNQPNIYPKLDLPKKILLVDDEKEFVHALSERLQTRNLESAVVYDGEEALSVMQADAPEVMVLDLKMPGIDGLEVLRRVKRDHPETEVIILTGHGSEQEQKLAEDLGAFAYLNKPVDIDVLAETMKNAYARIAERQGKASPEEGDS